MGWEVKWEGDETDNRQRLRTHQQPMRTPPCGLQGGGRCGERTVRQSFWHDITKKYNIGVCWCYLGEKRQIERGLEVGGLNVPWPHIITLRLLYTGDTTAHDIELCSLVTVTSVMDCGSRHTRLKNRIFSYIWIVWVNLQYELCAILIPILKKRNLWV